jgi:hypothetical protein
MPVWHYEYMGGSDRMDIAEGSGKLVGIQLLAGTLAGNNLAEYTGWHSNQELRIRNGEL